MNFQTRGKGKCDFKIDITTKNAYHKYNEGHKNDGFQLSKEDYDLICDKFAEKVIKKIIYENALWKIPFNGGNVFVEKNKAGLPIDWNLSKKYGKIIKHLNPHTSGYICKIKWKRGGCNYKNKGWYSFQPTRSFKRALKEAIQNNNELDFYVQ